MNPHELKDIREKLETLRGKALKLGIGNVEILSMVPRKLRCEQGTLDLGSWFSKASFIVFISLMFAYVVLQTLILVNSKETKFVLETIHNALKAMSLANPRCLVSISPFLVMYFRPPLECNFCENVSSIDRVQNLASEEFLKRYAYSGKPVVISDGFRDWGLNGNNNFSIQYIRGLYQEGSESFESCQFFPYYSSFSTLKDFLNTSIHDLFYTKRSWYVGWGNCNPKVAQKLRHLYKRPYFLASDMEIGRTDWIFMGKPGPGAFLHIDVVHSPTWQAQLKGLKKWTLKAPSECHYTCGGYRMQTTLQPGEIIVLDSNRWFHMTEVVGEEISIAIGAEFE